MPKDDLIDRFMLCLDELRQCDLVKIAGVFMNANHIFTVGNGGSAATASHLTADLIRIGLRSTCLSDNIAAITSFANDISYDEVFAVQLGMIKSCDAVVFLSVSGTSANLIRAIDIAKSRGATTIAFVGSGGGKISKIAKHSVILSSESFTEVEGVHSCICHMIPILIQEMQSPDTIAVFLDRDGTVNRDVHYCSRPDDFELLPNVAEAIKLLNDNHIKVIMITNQSGIARGYFTEEALDDIHAKMRAILIREGAHIDAIYYCPHHPSDDCNCRKPKVGLALKAIEKYKIRIKKSFVIGDSEVDRELAEAIGCQSKIIQSNGDLLPPVKEVIDEVNKKD